MVLVPGEETWQSYLRASSAVIALPPRFLLQARRRCEGGRIVLFPNCSSGFHKLSFLLSNQDSCGPDSRQSRV